MRSSRRAARVAVLFGALAVLSIPAGVVVAQLNGPVTLLESLWVSVPVAGVLGLVSLSASRRARYAEARTVRETRSGLVRAGRLLAWAGIYCAVVGGLALAVYGALRLSQ